MALHLIIIIEIVIQLPVRLRQDSKLLIPKIKF